MCVSFSYGGGKYSYSCLSLYISVSMNYDENTGDFGRFGFFEVWPIILGRIQVMGV